MVVKNTENASPAPVWARRLASEAGRENVAYCAGWDVRRKEAADLELLPYDLWTNRAHCVMLARAGVISATKLKAILKALSKLEALNETGDFELNPSLEDVHINVESFVEQEAGVASAGLMHTARSRNDQVATDMRLLLRDKTLAFAEGVLGLVETLKRLSAANVKTLMPGLTHHQPAAWTTLGHWAASHAFAFQRDAQALLDLLDMLNVSPLGAAASYGTSWKIDRAYAAKLMGFDGPQENSLDSVTNRSEFESRVAGVLAVFAQHAATLAQDLILFSSPPWSLMRIGDAYVTGSSIMPQKRNPDFAEVTKAKAALAGASAALLIDLTRGDPSGYNREQQWTKYVILDLFAELSPAPVVISGAIESLVFDKKRMVDLMRHDYLEAADAADHLAQSRGVPFRTAYRWLGEAVRVSEERKISLAEAINEVLTREKDTRPLDESEIKLLSTPEALVARRTSNGGPSPDAVKEQLTLLNAKMGTARLRVRKYRSSVEKGRSLLAAAMKKHS